MKDVRVLLKALNMVFRSDGIQQYSVVRSGLKRGIRVAKVDGLIIL